MFPAHKLSALLLAGFVFAACAASTDPDDSDDRRGALGKADSITGSCAESDACGGKAEGCWCDNQCWWYGDCCNDAGEICAVNECNANADTGCRDGKSCVAGTPNRCLTVSCEPLDAAGVGVCKMLLGFAWNGSECVGLSGCSCAGDGCDSLTDSATCSALHADCDVGSICDAQDAQGEGLCEMFMGYKWDGDKCVGMSGCSCVGTDCGALTDLVTCEALHADCVVPQSCGGIVYNPCDEGQFCDYGSHCGAGDQMGVCKTVPEVCTTGWAPACGCDGTTYGNTCEAHAESVSVAELGECPPPPPADDSCVDHCGGSSADSSCWCDSLCEGYGDCCDDMAAACD